MMCSRPVPNCPECGDELIHQTNRGPHESSSEFGQYVHDRGEQERRWREMYWMDVDGAIFKKKTLVLRIIEHKNRDDSLSQSQRDVLPLLAKALQLLASTRLIHPQSGVFVIYSNHPHDSAFVEQLKGWPRRKVAAGREMSGTELENFLTGEAPDDEDETEAAA